MGCPASAIAHGQHSNYAGTAQRCMLLRAAEPTAHSHVPVLLPVNTYHSVSAACDSSLSFLHWGSAHPAQHSTACQWCPAAPQSAPQSSRGQERVPWKGSSFCSHGNDTRARTILLHVVLTSCFAVAAHLAGRPGPYSCHGGAHPDAGWQAALQTC